MMLAGEPPSGINVSMPPDHLPISERAPPLAGEETAHSCTYIQTGQDGVFEPDER